MFAGRGTGAFKRMKKTGVYKASNNTFDPATGEGRSYEHWLYVRRIKGKVVFNNHNYSSTTNRHQSNMRSLLKSLGVKIHLTVDFRESLSCFESAALPGLYRKLFNLEIMSKRRRSKPIDLKYWKGEMREAEKEIKLARALGARMTRAEISALKASMNTEEAKRLENGRRARAARKAVEDHAKLVDKGDGEVFDPNAFQETKHETNNVLKLVKEETNA